MAINKAMKAALEVLSYPDVDIKKSYKLVRKVEKLAAKRTARSKNCAVRTMFVERDGYKIPIRVFSDATIRSRGVILFFHGGGWVNGDIDTYGNVCVNIAQFLSRTVVSVDYRRAPEYKFPTAPEDCYAVAKALFSGELLSEFLPSDIVLMGDSAGGNLAAAVSLMARDRGEFLPKRQVLIYPSLASDHSASSEFDSIRENGSDYLLTSKKIVGYMELYAKSAEDFNNPYLAPLCAKSFVNQPDTLIISAQYCPLRDEGEEYGKRLSECGNAVSVYRMPDAIHGYFSLPPSFKTVRKTYSVIRRFLGDDNIAQTRATSWIRLDNAAKIFPPTTTKRDAKVFRLYCELQENINPRLLQAALDCAIERFPFYLSILKKGIFWYYFEDSNLHPFVREEYKEPCSQLYDSQSKRLLFEVTYYRRRINFEVYHALTDGEGALTFFKTLVAYYLRRSHLPSLGDAEFIDYDASAAERRDDSFFRYYKGRKAMHVPKLPSSYHISGDTLDTPALGVIEGTMSVRALLDKAHEYSTTLTAFLVAVFIRAIADGMPLRDRARSIVLAVPVDLRQYFNSKSARNFFGIINVEYNVARFGDSLDEIIKQVKESMAQSLEREKISERMSSLSGVENFMPARILPVFMKDPGLKFANYLTERGVTAAFSNLGRIVMSDEFMPFIKKFGAVSSTSRMQACMCTFNDNFVIGFTSPFAATDIQCRFFRALSQMGIEIEITSNLGSDNNVIL